MTGDSATGLRRAVLAVLMVGSLGAAAELLLLDHYEDTWQFVPLVAIALAAAAVAWHLARPGAASLRALKTLMVAFILSGVLGIGLHFKGAAEFQLEIDPSQDWWTLATKALRAKAPPVLAPGLMTQLGALDLIYTLWYPTRPAGGHGHENGKARASLSRSPLPASCGFPGPSPPSSERDSSI